jgi:diacylglycerol kinase (ATP)
LKTTIPPTYLLLNPKAGGGSASDRAAALTEQVRGVLGELECIVAESAEDMSDAAERAARSGADRVIVAGGDGTVNIALNGLAKVSGALSRITLGILPAGTGNDLATALGVPRDMDAAIAALAAGRSIDLDLGEVNGRMFANASCGGYFGEVSQATTIELKSFAGRLAYVLAGAKVLLTHDSVTTQVRAETRWGALDWSGPVSLFAVCNGVTAGGGHPLAPDASVSDGWLDVVFVNDVSALGLAAVLLRMAGGDHVEDPRVSAFQVRSLDLRFERPAPINTDGEAFEVSVASYRVHPAATRLLVPA